MTPTPPLLIMAEILFGFCLGLTMCGFVCWAVGIKAWRGLFAAAIVVGLASMAACAFA